jgi:hypothetical protein
MVIGMPVSPPLPVTNRHRAKEQVHGLETLSGACSDASEPLHGPGQILLEVRWPSAVGSRVVLRIRPHTMRPRNRGPEPDQLHDRPAARADRFSPWSSAKNHVGGVTDVAEHLLRRQRTPTPPAVRLQGTETLFQRSQNSGIRYGLHRRRRPFTGPLPAPPNTAPAPRGCAASPSARACARQSSACRRTADRRSAGGCLSCRAGRR